ncbi:MAG: PKD domain-containing protein [Planctomycetales bacterium]|nr:PKD domain-containing protein [Planctomycetales bacterium]
MSLVEIYDPAVGEYWRRFTTASDGLPGDQIQVIPSHLATETLTLSGTVAPQVDGNELDRTATEYKTLPSLGGAQSWAEDINASGQIVGAAELPTGDKHAVLWQNGAVIDLGTLGGAESHAYAINNKGQVVGEAQTASGEWRAFLWEGGVITDLGASVQGNNLSHLQSRAWDVNENGRVVGTAVVLSGGGLSLSAPVAWDEGAFYLLDDPSFFEEQIVNVNWVTLAPHPFLPGEFIEEPVSGQYQLNGFPSESTLVGEDGSIYIAGGGLGSLLGSSSPSAPSSLSISGTIRRFDPASNFHSAITLAGASASQIPYFVSVQDVNAAGHTIGTSGGRAVLDATVDVGDAASTLLVSDSGHILFGGAGAYILGPDLVDTQDLIGFSGESFASIKGINDNLVVVGNRHDAGVFQATVSRQWNLDDTVIVGATGYESVTLELDLSALVSYRDRPDEIDHASATLSPTEGALADLRFIKLDVQGNPLSEVQLDDLTSEVQAAVADGRLTLSLRIELAGGALAPVFLSRGDQQQVVQLDVTIRHGLVADLYDDAGRRVVNGASLVDLRGLEAGEYWLRVYAANPELHTEPLPFEIAIDPPSGAPPTRFSDRDLIDGGDGDDTLNGGPQLDVILDPSGTDSFDAEGVEVRDWQAPESAPVLSDAGDLSTQLPTPLDFEVSFTNPQLASVIAARLGIALTTRFDGGVHPARPITASDLAQVTSLDLSYLGLADLADEPALQLLTNLRVLNLAGNSLSNLSAIGYSNLETLVLDQNPWLDLSTLASLPALTTLSIAQVWQTPAPGVLTPLARQEQLERLVASGNGLTDVSVLAALANLSEVDLSNNALTDIGPLLGSSIRDRSITGYQEYSERWIQSANSESLGGEFRMHPPVLTVEETQQPVAEWVFEDLAPGTYTLQANWSPHASRSAAARYRINGTTEVSIDQRLAPQGPQVTGRSWQNLGAVTVGAEGESVVVALHAALDGNVVADGIRLAPARPPEIQWADVTGNPLGNLAYEELLPALTADSTQVFYEDNPTAPVFLNPVDTWLVDSHDALGIQADLPLPVYDAEGAAHLYAAISDPSLTVTTESQDGDSLLRLVAPVGYVGSAVITLVAYDGPLGADGPMGRTATASMVVNIGAGVVEGVKFDDANHNHQRDPGEPGVEGWLFYVDLNQNEAIDTDEPYAITNTDGEYIIRGLKRWEALPELVREVPANGWADACDDNAPPVADPGESYTVAEGALLLLDGSGSFGGACGPIVSYQWDLDYDGTTFDIDATTATPSVSFADNGSRTVALRVTNEHGATAIATTVVEVTNAAPSVESAGSWTVNQGGLVAIPGLEFTDPGYDTPNSGESFAASIDWGDGTPPAEIVFLSWTNGSLGSPTQGAVSSSTHYDAPGQYQITVTVTDDDGGVGVSHGTVEVLPAIVPTVDLNASVTSTSPDQAVLFDAGGSFHPDAGRTLASYLWDADGDGWYESTTATPTYSFAYDAFGVYEAKVRVVDDAGASAAATLMVSTLEGNSPPNAFPAVTPESNGLRLYGWMSSDPDTAWGDQIVSYAWDFNGDGLDDLVFAESDNFVPFEQLLPFRNPLHGSWTVRLTVTDSLGATDDADYSFDVFGQPPTVDACGPYYFEYGDSVTLDAGNSSDPDTPLGDSIAEYAWDIDFDGTTDFATTTPLLTLTPNDVDFYLPGPGFYNLSFQVQATDQFDHTASATGLISILDPNTSGAPVIDGLAFSPTPPIPGEPVVLTATAHHTRPGQAIVRYDWDLGDGTQFSTTDPQATHSYTQAGQYSVTLTVIEGGASPQSATETWPVEVFDNQAPIADAGGAYELMGLFTLTLDASGSSDPDEPSGDQIVSYEWDLDNDGLFDVFTQDPTFEVHDAHDLYYAEDVTHYITLRVTDSFGATAMDTAILDRDPSPVRVNHDSGGYLNRAVEATLSNLVVAENNLGSFDVRLSAEPLDTVIVSLELLGVAEGWSLPAGATLTFTPANWDQHQSVAIARADDTDAVNATAWLRASASGHQGLFVRLQEADDDQRILVSAATLDLVEGEVGSFGVRLAGRPAGEVTVANALSELLGFELLVGETLTFTPENWEIEQEVFVRATQDSNAASESTTITSTSPGWANAEVSVQTLEANRQLLLSEAEIVVAEAGTASVDLRLAAPPDSEVTVTVSLASGDADTSVLSGAVLTFTPEDWDQPQTVTFANTADADAIDGQSIFQFTAPGWLSNSLLIAEADDDRGFELEGDTLSILEGESNTVGVRLAAMPDSAVTVSVLAIGPDEDLLTVNNGPLVFTPENWDQFQQIVVHAQDDPDSIDGSAIIQLVAEGWTAAEVVLTEVDDDRALAFTVSAIEVTEGGAAEVGLRLTSAPLADITVAVQNSSGDADLFVSGVLVFTPENWDTPQLVVVNAADDADGINGSAVITASAAGWRSVSLSAQEIDDDRQILLSSSAVAIAEGGEHQLGVRLAAQPAGEVAVSASWLSGDEDIALRQTSPLMFDPSNWDQLQYITIAALNDADSASGAANLLVSGDDWTPAELTASEVDDDRVIEVVALDTVVAEGTSRTYGVRLLGRPESPVEVSVSRVAGDADLTVVTGAVLNFTAANWAEFQPITVAASQDVDALHGAADFVAAATGWTAAAFSLQEADDDQRFLLEGVPGVLIEGEAASFTVRLAGQPAADVLVDVSRLSGDADIDVQPGGQLLFTLQNWDQPQSVSIAAAEDLDGRNDSATLQVAAIGWQPEQFTVTEGDNDRSLILDSTMLSTPEAGLASLGVRLAAEPEGEVLVTTTKLAGDSDIKLRTGAYLVFTPGNWSTPQHLTLAAIQDIDANNGAASFTTNAAGWDQVQWTAVEADDDSDLDADGVADSVEALGPNAGDGNGDGTPDGDQDNVAATPNAIDNGYVVLATADGNVLANVTPLAGPDPSTLPPGIALPVGAFQFELHLAEGETASTVTLYLPEGTAANTYYKYGPTATNPVPHWYEFLYNGTTGALIQGNTITLYFVDGQRGDSDLTANGVILDPGATAYAPIDGDFDRNGRVDQDDYLTWRADYGRTGDNLRSDGNHDGRVDAADYTLWRDNLGTVYSLRNLPGEPSEALTPMLALAPLPGAAGVDSATPIHLSNTEARSEVGLHTQFVKYVTVMEGKTSSSELFEPYQDRLSADATQIAFASSRLSELALLLLGERPAPAPSFEFEAAPTREDREAIDYAFGTLSTTSESQPIYSTEDLLEFRSSR